MSQPIVPLTVPQSRRFEKKSRNFVFYSEKICDTILALLFLGSGINSHFPDCLSIPYDSFLMMV